nr:hypothetical protein ['Planchonia careya' phytoplasma]
MIKNPKYENNNIQHFIDSIVKKNNELNLRENHYLTKRGKHTNREIHWDLEWKLGHGRKSVGKEETETLCLVVPKGCAECSFIFTCLEQLRWHYTRNLIWEEIKK